MKFSSMLHFIWVFTVCKSTRLRVSRIQKVKGGFLCIFAISSNMYHMCKRLIIHKKGLNVGPRPTSIFEAEARSIISVFFYILKRIEKTKVGEYA